MLRSALYLRLKMLAFLLVVDQAAVAFEPDPCVQNVNVSAVKQQAAIDLRPRFAAAKLNPRQQGRRGACQVFAFVAPIEYQLAWRKQPARLSEQFLMWSANQSCQLQRTGGFNPDLLFKGLKEHGICKEELMPYIPEEEPIARPSEVAIRDAMSRRRFTLVSIKHWSQPVGFSEQDLNDIMTKLSAGLPVTATVCWPTGLYDEQIIDRNFFLVDRNIDRSNKSGHGVVLVGYQKQKSAGKDGYFIVQNTWGEKFGDKGYLNISFAMLRKYGIDAYVVLAH